MDFNDGTPKLKFSAKQLAIIAGGVIVAMVILVFVVRLIRSESSDQSIVQTQRETIEQTCQKAQDKTACLAQLSTQAAKQTGQIELCTGLEPQAYDSCVWDAASAQEDASLCASLTDPDKRLSCADTLYLSAALSSNDVALCDKIEDVAKKNGCKRVAPGPITAENCLARGEEQAYCQMLSVAQEANQKQDPRLCDALSEDFAVLCRDRVQEDDRDFDGLSSPEEIEIYKTNPDKSDTDGDGYKDGDEVASGYNPNGPGKLP